MSRRTNSSLFLIEQVIVILIFSICATACVKIFVESYLTTHLAKDISHALLAAESAAETYKAVDGDLARTAVILGGANQDTGVFVYYDANWQPCALEDVAYMLTIACRPLPTEPIVPLCADLAVEKITGDELVAFTVAAGGTWDE